MVRVKGKKEKEIKGMELAKIKSFVILGKDLILSRNFY